jgi:L-asparaginase
MIHIIFTGGTISMRRDEHAGGNVPTHGGEALLAFAPGIKGITEVRVDDWARLPACHLDHAKLWQLRNHVRSVAAGEGDGPFPQGIVITHGTDTIEETAYLLSRTLPAACPVVITGAMRTSDAADWDGPRNLTDAVRVAATPASRGRGTLVCFAGRIFAGHQAVKTHATDILAFSAPHAAAVGSVSGNRVDFGAPSPAARDPLEPAELKARVALVPVVTGDQGELLDLARPSHDGVVLVAYGSGNVPPGVVPAVRRWIAEGKPVVLASRCPFGEVTPVYAFPGGGATLIREGVVVAGPRSPSQARMELLLSLSAGRPYGA